MAARGPAGGTGSRQWRGGQGDVVWRVAAPVGVDEAAAALAGVDQHVAARSSARQPPVVTND